MSIDDAPPLHKSILAVLGQCPSYWTEIDKANSSETECLAIDRLVKMRMLEYEVECSITLNGSSMGMRRFGFTGSTEYLKDLLRHRVTQWLEEEGIEPTEGLQVQFDFTRVRRTAHGDDFVHKLKTRDSRAIQELKSLLAFFGGIDGSHPGEEPSLRELPPTEVTESEVIRAQLRERLAQSTVSRDATELAHLEAEFADDDGEGHRVRALSETSELSCIPSLRLDNGTWIRAKDVRSIDGLEVRTLATYRSNSPVKSADGAAGIDKDGRMWRKPGGGHPWYLLSSLKNSS